MSNASANATMIGFTGMTTPHGVYFSRMFLISSLLCTLAYGAQLVLYLAVMHALWVRILKSGKDTSMPYKTMGFVTALFVLNTIFCITTVINAEEVYVDDAAYPGGFLVYFLFSLELPVNIIAQAVFAGGSILADGFLLWRTYCIFKAVRGRYWVVFLVPGMLIFAAAIAISVMYQIDADTPNGVFGNTTTNWASIYFSCSFGLNAYLTLLIMVRIWSYQRTARRTLGSKFGRPYTTLSTMFIESAALYSIVAIGGVASYKSAMNLVWLNIALPTQTIASYLITYRIARGLEWEATASSLDGRDSTEMHFTGHTKPSEGSTMASQTITFPRTSESPSV